MSDPRGMMRGMLVITSELRRCEVCGDPIRRDNKYGICANGSKPNCLEARRRKRPRRAPEPRSEPSRCCDVCGRPINRNNQSGVCGRGDNLACVRERGRRNAKGSLPILNVPYSLPGMFSATGLRLRNAPRNGRTSFAAACAVTCITSVQGISSTDVPATAGASGTSQGQGPVPRPLHTGWCRFRSPHRPGGRAALSQPGFLPLRMRY